jgi:Zn-dependent peptidase ImmA (M78 family)/DNA-binding XRE family transcriptional regulator
MLTLAREYRGWTQSELADDSGITQGYISLLENGQKDAADDKIEKIAQSLRFPTSFFYQSERFLGLGLTFVFHRKKSSARVGDLRRLQAEVNLRRIHMTRLLRSVPVKAFGEFTMMDIDDHDGDAEAIATFVRANWKLPIGPIPNLIRTIESAGGIVFRFKFGTSDVDAISHWPDDGPPFFFINSQTPADRARYSLAHEVGHVVMHRSAAGDIEAEADRFASEFLMPESAIAPQLDGMSIKLAAKLKPYWRVSMQALIRRARDVGRISDADYSRLFRQVASLGMRKNEPVSILPEAPELADKIIAEFQRENRCSTAEISAVLDLHVDEFMRLYGRPDFGLRVVTTY